MVSLVGQIHPDAEASHFHRYPLDRDLVRPFLTCFDVTHAFRKEVGRGRVSAFYLKPERFLAEQLGLEREVLLVYAPFPEFQARTLQLHDEILDNDRVRLDTLGSIIVSDAADTRDAVRNLIENDPERLPVVGLSKAELDGLRSADDVRKLAVREFFKRDLFALESPLTMDTSFFGRQEMVAQLLDRFKAGQNSGLFGLRRIGKTSVLYALGRRIKEGHFGRTLYLDLRSPALYRRRWWELLEEIVRKLALDLSIKAGPGSRLTAARDGYSERQAAADFRADIERILKGVSQNRLLLALDEIENITFDISPAEHWHADFLPLWQTLQSVHQETGNRFVFNIAGVNPHPMERSTVGAFDNPLFSTAKPFYLGPFDHASVRNMVRRLGRYMGLRFEEDVFPLIEREYGGHPFLIRQACSRLASRVPDRPGRITNDIFQREREGIAVTQEKNVRYILQVLEQWYPYEFELICALASGDVATFVDFARDNAEFTEHMEGYGLVIDARSSPRIAIDLVRSYLARVAKRGLRSQATLDDVDAIQAEISRRRNRVERRLRQLMSDGLRLEYGIQKAAGKALEHLGEGRRSELIRFAYDQMWDEMYFGDLVAIVEGEWSAFSKWFSAKKDELLQWLRHINRSRADAHARRLSEEDLAYLRICFRRLEEELRLDSGS